MALFVPWREALFAGAGQMSTMWIQFFTMLTAAVGQVAQVAASVALTAQSASVPATDFAILTVGGNYRVSYRARVTQAAGATSSLAVTIGWTDGGVACSHTFAALTTNLPTTIGSDAVIVQADAGTVITYALVYASTGVPAMAFAANLWAEALP